MNTFLYVLVFILSFVIILKGGDILVESSICLSKKAGVPSVVVGATLVALATTFPETTIAFFSGKSGAVELAVNTAIGSMLCNFALVLGLSFLIKPTSVNKANFAGKVAYFIASIIILFILGIDGKLTTFDAVILCVVFILFLVQNFAGLNSNLETGLQIAEVLPAWHTIIIEFLISALCIGCGASLMVSNIDALSEILGISEGFLGLFIVSIGTNIPEFVTTMASIKLGSTEIGIGNIFGSSIIDATLLMVVTILSTKNNVVPLPTSLLLLSVPLLILIAFIIIMPIIKKGKTSRVQGAFLLGLFFFYTLLITLLS